ASSTHFACFSRTCFGLSLRFGYFSITSTLALESNQQSFPDGIVYKITAAFRFDAIDLFNKPVVISLSKESLDGDRPTGLESAENVMSKEPTTIKEEKKEE
ncbi:homolog of yeast autophagy 18 (ATG18) B, partial [Striga asiatica]